MEKMSTIASLATFITDYKPHYSFGLGVLLSLDEFSMVFLNINLFIKAEKLGKGCYHLLNFRNISNEAVYMMQLVTTIIGLFVSAHAAD